MDDIQRNTSWEQAQDRFQQLVQERAVISFDMQRLEAALYDDIIYEHVDKILREEANLGEDGRRYVPRLMMAVVMLLHEKARG